MARQAKIERDFRAAVSKALDETPNLDENLRSLIDEMFTAEATKKHWVTIVCKDCGKERRYEVLVPMPDWVQRVKAIDMLATQGKGKPAETRKVDLSIGAARTRAELEQASDEDLLLLASGAAAGAVDLA